MQLGEFVQISEEYIEQVHDRCGDKKQRYREEHAGHLGGTGYTSMYPITKDTKAYCVFINPISGRPSCYIPHEEPLLRKYPKRTLQDSFLAIHRDCKVSVIDRVMDIRELPIDVQAAYLYYGALKCRSGGIFLSLMKNFHTGGSNIESQTRSVEAFGRTEVRQIVKENDIALIKSFMDYQRTRLSCLLSYGLGRAGSRIGSRYRESFGNILEELFRVAGVNPAPSPPRAYRKDPQKKRESGKRQVELAKAVPSDVHATDQFVIAVDNPSGLPIVPPPHEERVIRADSQPIAAPSNRVDSQPTARSDEGMSHAAGRLWATTQLETLRNPGEDGDVEVADAESEDAFNEEDI